MSGEFGPLVDSIDVSGEHGSYSRKRISTIAAADVFAARSIETGLDALLIELRSAALSGIDQWPAAKGFEVEVEPVDARARMQTRVCVKLVEARFQDIFRVLCDDVCLELAGAENQADCVARLQQRLSRWQSFLKKHRGDGLSEEAQVGLYGELLVMIEVLFPVLGAVAVVQGWRGCRKAHQDFQFRRAAIEVKTSRAVVPDRVHISNLQQLDDDDLDLLVLSLVSVHSNPASGESLPELIARIRQMIPEGALDDFDDGLAEVGYLDAHAQRYFQPLYFTRSIEHFRVVEAFPRLLTANMPDGVKSVRYEISIDSARPYKIAADTLSQELRAL